MKLIFYEGKRIELKLLRYANMMSNRNSPSQAHRVSRSCDTIDVIDNEVKNVMSLCRYVSWGQYVRISQRLSFK